MDIYSIDSGTLAYRSGKRTTTVFENLRLCVPEGSFLVVMGPSGSGKTSLINVLAGFTPLTSGRALFLGTDLAKMTPGQASSYRTRSIGMVHQFFNLIPEFSAEQNVMTPLLLAGHDFRTSRERANELLDDVGLSHRARYRTVDLSGGEMQRVAIARAVANEPDVLLCDEPTGNLDAKNSEAILQLLSDVRAKRNRTVVMVTHDPKAANVASDLVEM